MDDSGGSLCKLREHDAQTQAESESHIPVNGRIFAEIIDIHFELLTQAHNRNPGRKQNGLDRALRLMAARATHVLRAMWMACMAGYQGAQPPLMRTLFETSLTMHYLRTFPDDFLIWKKATKSNSKERRFWPGAMMNRLAVRGAETTIYSALANATHTNPSSLTLIGSYERESDVLQISVGQGLSASEGRRISVAICLMGAISVYNIVRTVKDADGDGLPGQQELDKFLERLKRLTDSLEREVLEGTPVLDIFSGE